MIPTSTNVSLATRTKLPANMQAVVVFATQDGKLNGEARAILPAGIVQLTDQMLEAGVASGKAREVVFDLQPSAGGIFRIYVAGLGPINRLSTDAGRVAGAAVLRTLRKDRVRRFAVVPPAAVIEGVVSGLLLAAFTYAEHKGTATKDDKESEGTVDRFAITVLAAADERDEISEAVDRARVIADAQNYARTIAFRPGNDVNPLKLAGIAQALAKDAGLKATVFDEKQLARLGMGGILAVGAGSPTPPRLIVLEYDGRGANQRRAKSAAGPVLLVGKAITFDTGGISIKPADRMGLMVFDKCGGTTVLATLYAVAMLKLPVHVVGIIPSAENHISGTAYRPGDIVKMYNGVTVEVNNTDAEGRLILGDAMAWGVERYKPRAMVDLATLTGACIVALGHTYAGAFANDDKLFGEIANAAQVAGEKLWRMPLDDDYKEMLKSVPADIINSPGRWGGACTGAAFLHYFVPKGTPWLHLDIAPTADTERDLPYYTKGATGWGVRTLVEWLSTSATSFVK